MLVQPHKHDLSPMFIEEALAAQSVWDFGNSILYKMCSDYPTHDTMDVIIGKVWLIGRSYAAAVERRRHARSKGDRGDDYYVETIGPKLFRENIDEMFCVIRGSPEQDSARNLNIHGKFTEILKNITGLEKRSFASKYLHFHFPGRFYLYDSKAATSVRRFVTRKRGTGPGPETAAYDKEYAQFYWMCEVMNQTIGGLIGRQLTPRELDKVLLFAHEKHQK